jgi:hypothetical protein
VLRPPSHLFAIFDGHGGAVVRYTVISEQNHLGFLAARRNLALPCRCRSFGGGSTFCLMPATDLGDVDMKEH